MRWKKSQSSPHCCANYNSIRHLPPSLQYYLSAFSMFRKLSLALGSRTTRLVVLTFQDLNLIVIRVPFICICKHFLTVYQSLLFMTELTLNTHIGQNHQPLALIFLPCPLTRNRPSIDYYTRHR